MEHPLGGAGQAQGSRRADPCEARMDGDGADRL